MTFKPELNENEKSMVWILTKMRSNIYFQEKESLAMNLAEFNKKFTEYNKE